MPYQLQYVERQIIAWLLIAMGAFFLARAVVGKRERGAMKELLGVRVDKVKGFRIVLACLVGVLVMIQAYLAPWMIPGGAP